MLLQNQHKMITSASDQCQLAKINVQITEQLKLNIQRYFLAVEHFQNTTTAILNDFKTPRAELLERLRAEYSAACKNLD